MSVFWSPEEEAFVTECANAKIRAEDIAPLMNRSVAAVRMKRHKLGLAPPSGRLFIMTAEHGGATVAEIKRTVAEHFNIPLESMVSPERTRKVARPRQVAMFFAREVALKSYPRIGQLFGGRDHSTAIHARQTVERLCSENEAFADEIRGLQERFSVVDNRTKEPFVAIRVGA